MAKVYISKSILPNKPLNTFISCVSKHSLKREFSSAVLREGKACLTVPSFCAAPSILFPGGIEAVGTFTIFFVIALVCSALLQRRGKVWLYPCTSEVAPSIKKWGLKTAAAGIKARSWPRAVITADGLKRKNTIKNKRKREVDRETQS